MFTSRMQQMIHSLERKIQFMKSQLSGNVPSNKNTSSSFSCEQGEASNGVPQRRESFKVPVATALGTSRLQEVAAAKRFAQAGSSMSRQSSFTQSVKNVIPPTEIPMMIPHPIVFPPRTQFPTYPPSNSRGSSNEAPPLPIHPVHPDYMAVYEYMKYFAQLHHQAQLQGQMRTPVSQPLANAIGLPPMGYPVMHPTLTKDPLMSLLSYQLAGLPPELLQAMQFTAAASASSGGYNNTSNVPFVPPSHVHPNLVAVEPMDSSPSRDSTILSMIEEPSSSVGHSSMSSSSNTSVIVKEEGDLPNENRKRTLQTFEDDNYVDSTI